MNVVSYTCQTKLNIEKGFFLLRGYYTLLHLPSVMRSIKTQLHSDGNGFSFSIWALFGDNRGCVFECGNFGCRTFLFKEVIVCSKKF